MRSDAMGGGCGRRTTAVVLGVWLALVFPAAAHAEEAAANGVQRGPVIEIWKSRRMMQLREGSAVVRQFDVSLGYSPSSQKRVRGDTRTPEGRYYVCSKKPASEFHRFLGLSYPNVEDADRGYQDHLISAREWADLFISNLRYGTPSSSTALGGWVGIHGTGGHSRSGDWTKGCIAVSDDEIDFIYDRVTVGTPVIINE